MKTIAFACFYERLESTFGRSYGEADYGYRLLEAEVRLRQRLESEEWTVATRRDIPLEQADVVVFGDLDEKLWQIAGSLSAEKSCLLQACESPIYAPWSHFGHIVFDRRWRAVLTWNRGFEADHIVCSRLSHLQPPELEVIDPDDVLSQTHKARLLPNRYLPRKAL